MYRVHTVCPDDHTPHPPCTPFKHTECLREGDHKYQPYLPHQYGNALTELMRTERKPSKYV